MFKRFFLSERNMLIAIAINAFIICLLYFPQCHQNKTTEHLLITFDHIFVFIFLLEAIVKIAVLKPKGYFKDGWNIFDLFIVLVSLPSLFTFIPFFALHDYGVFKILRLFRMIRLAKLLQFVPRMNMIMAGLGRALKASVFVILVLVFLNFMLAIFTCHFYGELAPEFFGDPAISAYTIFQLFTVEGWNEISDILIEKTQNPLLAGLTRFYLVIVVLVGGIFGMSLANAVFVDEMTMDNTIELEEKIDKLEAKIDELKTLLQDGGRTLR